MANTKIDRNDPLKVFKRKILAYRDLWGGEIMDTQKIIESQTKEELIEVLSDFNNHIEAMCSDAQQYLWNFRKKFKH